MSARSLLKKFAALAGLIAFIGFNLLSCFESPHYRAYFSFGGKLWQNKEIYGSEVRDEEESGKP